MEATKLSLKLLVDKKANKVIFAEAEKDFVDFLFHLLSLPIGSVIGLLSSSTMVGCIGNLYKSIEDLNVAYLHANQNKDLLLKPKAPTTASTSLPLLLPSNHASPEPIGKLYNCVNYHRYVSDKYGSACPSCLGGMSYEVRWTPTNQAKTGSTSEGGYVKDLVTYMVMDDLSVTPISMIAGIAVLNKCNIREFDVLEEMKVDFGIDEGLQLLRASLQSKEALTSVFLVKEKSKDVPVSTEFN
ncbi:hypothetical protein CJ030_MR3G014624 [Morella rubra]|uniref:DUF674 domain-containing protein n=1 Tax=Morella rubra TaxID=262757 RepID=A0A6A1W0W4_9ROSI|nr:hypothetical protein CJ030_MR3G014626 [Morella rubra]KAB1217966.1 hypothetical protein CJ030_MR3G014624 [Morella rubra]